MLKRPCLRGIFAFEDEESPEWRDVVLKKGIPKFATKEECEEFLRENCARGSNPKYPKLKHVFSLLIDQQQINSILLEKIAYYDKKYPLRPPTDLHPSNCFSHADGLEVAAGIERRMQLPFHRELNRVSTFNSLAYLFEHMRCGIFVMIRHGRVVLFVPFCNKDYVNNWGSKLKFDSSDGSMREYYNEKEKSYRKENIIEDCSKWWANGNIICNEHCRPGVKLDETQYWGDQFLTQLRDMLEEACQKRKIPDCEFFINKRDYPHLKENRTEPYGFLFDRDDRLANDDLKLQDHYYNTYAPIMSFYISDKFADLPFPCSEDWEAATGLVFVPSFNHTHCRNCPCKNSQDCQEQWNCVCTRKMHGIESCRDLFTFSNFKMFHKSWDEKVNTAFFRGTATGGGTTIETNQRLHLASLSHSWKEDPRYNENDTNPPFLDACVTAWNMRDKKIAGNPMTFCKKNSFKFDAGRQHFIPIYDQSKYKYILYVEGHCAANRYAFLMRLGSVILKVKSRCVADEMWYWPLLKEMEDHIPIQQDLSDLAEKIQWCRDNDDKCKAIAARAKALYDTYLSREPVLDYVELLCTNIAKRFRKPIVTPKVPWNSIPKPFFPELKKNSCKNDSLCMRCQETSLEQKNSDSHFTKRKRNDYDYGYGHGHGYGYGRESKQMRRNVQPKSKNCRKCRRDKEKCACY